ncbi:MAG TPA: hypothetical protein VGG03_12375 [Thermoanaerobaculia bacterium]|jgi:hypothetical protein
MADLEVTPKKVSLSARQAQLFQATRDGQPVTDVTWSVEKGDGKIDPPSGVYKSPWFIFRDRKVTIKATPNVGGTPATATVDLISISFWTQFLGLYWFLCIAALAIFLMFGWKRLCPTCEVLVSPPVVTLTNSQTQVFSANIPVTWGPLEAVNGLYRAPAKIDSDQRVTITAASKSDPDETATADVFLTSDFGFSLQPTSTTVAAGGTVYLAPVTAPGTTVEWLRPAIGKIQPAPREAARPGSAKFTAPAVITRPTTVQILARTIKPVGGIAGAHVTILPSSWEWRGSDCASRTATGLLALIAIMGALGGLVHGISSFTTYVGNRELLTSWIWWYIFKPFLGALVAVVVYLVFRAGLGGEDYALSSADCLKTSAFAALIGLFAEPATIKLKDIFDTIFTPRRDPREDRAGETKPAKLERLDPTTLNVGQSPLSSLKVIGTGFTKDSKIKVGAALRDTSFVSETELQASLIPDDVAKAQELTVTVYNKPPEGAPSNSLTLTVAESESKPAKLESLNPSTLKVGQSPLPSLKIIGTGFTKDSKVKVGAALRETSFVSETELQVPLTPDDVAKDQKLPVIVYNQPPEGSPSNSLDLTVEPG